MLVIEIKNIDDLIKEFQSKMSSENLVLNKTLRNDEINALNRLARDPRRMYEEETIFDEQFKLMQVDEEKSKIIKPPQQSAIKTKIIAGIIVQIISKRLE